MAALDVIDETFIGFSAAVDPDWAGFWSLDDHRGWLGVLREEDTRSETGGRGSGGGR